MGGSHSIRLGSVLLWVWVFGVRELAQELAQVLELALELAQALELAPMGSQQALAKAVLPQLNHHWRFLIIEVAIMAALEKAIQECHYLYYYPDQIAHHNIPSSSPS